MKRMSRAKRPKTKRSAGTRNEALAPLLKELVLLNKQQINRETPQVSDAQPFLQKRNKIYTFWKAVDKGTLSYSTSIETDGAYGFYLGDLPEVSSLTAIFDTYRIIQVRVCFQPQAINNATSLYPPITTAIDYDDTNSTTASALKEYDSALVIPCGQFFERCFTPRIATSSYTTGATFTGYSQHSLQWNDCASTTIQHYGLKFALPVATASNPVWDVTAHYVVQFRNSR